MDGDGYCQIRGRLKDMITQGGENIYPREIEDVIFTHPSVANASVVGIPDPDWGEQVAAFVEVHSGVTLREDELDLYCRSRLASFKVPRFWRFVRQLSQTAPGKIEKFSLLEQLMADMGE